MPDTIANLLDTVICGDVLDKLPGILSGSVHCVVTSPPYWGLRDYGVDGQLGLEKTPEEYIAKMVAVFREVWRVLRDDGTLWLNMGDSYATGNSMDTRRRDGYNDGRKNRKERFSVGAPGLKPKDLCGIPWRLALALQSDGWYLRQDIIWHKPNPMPESVTDRCTKAHEYIFLMTKKPRYWYDAEAIKEDASTAGQVTGGGKKYSNESAAKTIGGSHNLDIYGETDSTRNKRSVWTVPTCAYPEAHFATFPPKLIEPCILAGCPEWVCVKCGEPRRRIVEKPKPPKGVFTQTKKPTDGYVGGFNYDGEFVGTGQKLQNWLNEHPATTTGWTKCNCNAKFDGGIVLDPFGGAFTTALVAYRNNRHYTIIELSEEYVKLGKARMAAEKNKYSLLENKSCTMPDPMVSLKETHVFKEPAQ